MDKTTPELFADFITAQAERKQDTFAEAAPMYNVTHNGRVIGVHQHGKGFISSRPNEFKNHPTEIPNGAKIDHEGGPIRATKRSPKIQEDYDLEQLDETRIMPKPSIDRNPNSPGYGKPEGSVLWQPARPQAPDGYDGYGSPKPKPTPGGHTNIPPSGGKDKPGVRAGDVIYGGPKHPTIKPKPNPSQPHARPLGGNDKPKPDFGHDNLEDRSRGIKGPHAISFPNPKPSGPKGPHTITYNTAKHIVNKKFEDVDYDDLDQLNEWEWDPANIAGAALLGTAAYQVGKHVVGGIVNAAGDYVDNRRMQMQHQRYLDRVAARKAATAAAKQAKEAAKQARAAKKAGGASGQAVAEQYADYISSQDRGYLTEASQRVQRMVDSCNKKVLKDADPLKGHELEYDGERVHVVHPKKGVVGSFKPYQGIDTEGMLYSARRMLNPRRDSDDALPPETRLHQAKGRL